MTAPRGGPTVTRLSQIFRPFPERLQISSFRQSNLRRADRRLGPPPRASHPEIRPCDRNGASRLDHSPVCHPAHYTRVTGINHRSQLIPLVDEVLLVGGCRRRRRPIWRNLHIGRFELAGRGEQVKQLADLVNLGPPADWARTIRF